VRTVYLGTSDFAVQVLRRLADSPHKPALVVTRPDRPKGRGRKLRSPPVADAARLMGLPVYQPDDVNSEEARERIAAAQPDEVVICAFGALIKEPLLSEHRMLNVHPSLLPRWRGAAPIERAIDAGDATTGVCIMRPVAAMDAGPVCACKDIEIRRDDDYDSLSRRLATAGGELLVKVLDEGAECTEQPSEGITLADKITSEDRRLDPARPADELERRVRALNPHVGTWLELPNGERLGVRRAIASGTGTGSMALSTGTGTLRAEDGRLYLGDLELLEVQPAGGRAMEAAAWLRGQGARILG
jgi:methionyl-tRNA formyltransferase